MVVLWACVSTLTGRGAIQADPPGGQDGFACEPIALRMCQDLPYNTTFTPNPLDHHDQQAAQLAMEMMYSISSENGFWKVKLLVLISIQSRFFIRNQYITERA
ncbi:hypothetical protein AAFF_G00298570 [Aldrovandia affinis]|uniref:FZ domain-containing protein n=1 Tax=Aldrovandia affinis TaxID=143900 RepID=A0AAD7W1B5_9TELE|nr:hypothetical protein AAFF_G00298570 [Aldrovandia affinis]